MSYYRQGPHRPSGTGVRFGVPGLTPYVKILIIACAAVWVVQAVLFFLVPGRIDLSRFFGVVPALVVQRFFLWQPATSMFLHHPADIFHLLFNMLMLWMFGGELERHWGGRAFLRYYLVSGIGAGVIVPVNPYIIEMVANFMQSDSADDILAMPVTTDNGLTVDFNVSLSVAFF